MYTLWTKGLSDKEKEQWTVDVLAAQPVLKKLHKVLKDTYDASEKAMRSKNNYETASWAYLQADLLGEQRSYKKTLNLLENIIEDKIS